MGTSIYRRSDLHRILLKWRWLIMAWVGFVGTLLEIIERVNQNDLAIDYDFIVSILVEGLLIPFLGVVLLEILQKASIKQIQAANHLSQKEALSHLIGTAPNWNELVRVIVEFPGTFIPLNGSALFLFDAATHRYVTAGLWGFFNIHSPVTLIQPPDVVCPACAASRTKPFLYFCQCKMIEEPSQPLKEYALPLIVSGTIVGILYLFLPGDIFLSEDQQYLLSSVGPDMALALDNARIKQINQDLKQVTEGEKRKIARDLHDNMAQNLNYVRQKLFEFTEDQSITGNQQLHQDMIRIYGVVDEIYMDLREILRELESTLEIDLDKLLSDYTQSLKDRMSFEIQYGSNGFSRRVPKRIAHQILYIVGELFANIEKHAGAKVVMVTLEWQAASLVLRVCDNGQGFDPLAVTPEGHYGLAILHERAEEIRGRLNIKTAPGTGTEVTLWLSVGSIA